MEFTYKAYEELINILNKNEYKICSYHDYINHEKCVILRHDVDTSLEKALGFAKFENILGIQSTYFVLLSSNFYNIASAKNIEIIYKIKEYGHEIGLHFDEIKYSKLNFPINNGELKNSIEKEIKIMSDVLGFEINTVSMHRPSKETLAANYKLNNAINSYSKTFFEEFKYLSDSRFNWREPVLDIVENNIYKKLHILTHAFWYSEIGDTASEICRKFVNNANRERYIQMNDNIRDFTEFMKEEEIK